MPKILDKPSSYLNRSVRRGWFFSYLMVLTVPLILCLLLYTYSYRVISAESEKSYGSTLDQMRIDLDAYLTEILQVQQRMMLDQSVQQATKLTTAQSGQSQLQLRSAMRSLSSIELNHPNISNLFVVLNGVDGVIGPKGYASQSLFYDIYCQNCPLGKEELWQIMRAHYSDWAMINTVNEDGKEEIWFLRTSMTTSIGDDSATVVVAISRDLLQQRLTQFQWDPGLDLIAVGMDGQVASSTALDGVDPAYLEQPAGTSFSLLQDHMVLVQNSEYPGWRYILVLSKGLMMRNTAKVQLFTWLGLVLCMLLGIGLSRKFTLFNYRPLHAMMEQFVPKGNQKDPSLTDKNEYEQLEYYVQKYYRERGDVQRELWNNERALRQYFLYSVLQYPRSAEEIRRDNERYKLDLDETAFHVAVLFSVGKAPAGKEVSYELVQFAMLNVFQDAASAHFRLMTTEVGPAPTAVVAMNADTPEALDCLEEDIRFTAQKIQEYFNVTVRAALGGVHEGVEGMSASYAEALEAMSYLLAGEDSDVICYRDICDARANYTFPLEIERRLIDLVASGNGEQAADLVRRTFPLGENSAVNAPGVARCLAYDITAALIKGASQGGVEDFDNVRFNNGDTHAPEEMQRHLTRIAITLCERVRLNRENASPNVQLCADIRKYIEENYADPDLNISQTGLHFNMTPAYLSKIFKNETGVSLLGCIGEVRIRHAKDLLMQGVPVSRIAEQTGFRDSSALIRVFKKETGLTPGAYRAQQLGRSDANPN